MARVSDAAGIFLDSAHLLQALCERLKQCLENMILAQSWHLNFCFAIQQLQLLPFRNQASSNFEMSCSAARQALQRLPH